MTSEELTAENDELTQVLVVDDEPNICQAWARILRDDEFLVHGCLSAEEAIRFLRRHLVDVVLTDICMPTMDGRELLRSVKANWPEIEVILMTGHGSIRDAVEATKEGAFDYITKPFRDLDHCVRTVRKAGELHRLRAENLTLRKQMDADGQGFLLESQSPLMRRLLTRLARVARVDSSVLISGRTGTGKSMIAREIHRMSPRREGPIVTMDCAAINEGVIESELFGHEKGAFSGAVAERRGYFELADGGTLFLDEIGDMPLEMQRRLLTALQNRRIRRVGGQRDIEVDVRVLSASARDLSAAIEEGDFRQELYYRLRVVELRLPDLNERREDIPRLVYHLMRQIGRRVGIEEVRIAPEAMDLLVHHDWGGGNVRELEHTLEAAMVFAHDDQLTAESLRLELGLENRLDLQPLLPAATAVVDLSVPYSQAAARADRAFRAHYLRASLEQGESIAGASRVARLDRSNFRREMRKYGLSREEA